MVFKDFPLILSWRQYKVDTDPCQWDPLSRRGIVAAVMDCWRLT